MQVSIIGGVILFLGLIIIFLRKNAFSLKYALLWLLTAAVMLIMGIFPSILLRISHLLGFEVASNALFSMLLGFVIIILLQQTATISKQNDKVKNLVQNNALLEKRIRELEDNNK
jgi:hypothetical protein